MRLAALALLAACARPPPVATEADAARAHVALAELERGRSLLLARCGSCHDTPLPSREPAADWPRRVGDMAARAGLRGDEPQVIAAYLIALDR